MPGKGAVTAVDPNPIKPGNAIAKLRTELEKRVCQSSCATFNQHA